MERMVIMAFVKSIVAIGHFITASIVRRPVLTALSLIGCLEVISSTATFLIPSVLPLEVADVYSLLAGHFVTILYFLQTPTPHQPRPLLLTICTTAWAWRLSLFLLRRTLRGFHDPRLDNIRGSRKGALLWCIAQTVWIFTTLLPVWIGMGGSAISTRLGIADIFAIAGFAIGWIFEAVSDEQRANFVAKLKRGEIIGGVKWCQTGLFRFCRFPNYFGEWLMWTSLSFVAFRATDHWTRYTLPICPWFLYKLLHVSINISVKKMKNRLTEEEFEKWSRLSLFFPNITSK